MMDQYVEQQSKKSKQGKQYREKHPKKLDNDDQFPWPVYPGEVNSLNKKVE